MAPGGRQNKSPSPADHGLGLLIEWTAGR